MKRLVVLSLILLACGASFLIGQKTMLVAYDPHNLEHNTLRLVAGEHMYGCEIGMAEVCKGLTKGRCSPKLKQAREEWCRTSAQFEMKFLERFWRQNAWKKGHE